MERLLFGTGGIPNSAKGKSTIAGIERIAELGLGCMELEFVYGVKMGRETALTVAEIASKRKIMLTAHAPYYVNLNAREPGKLNASQERILRTARIAALCGAVSITFHAASYSKDTPAQVYEQVKKNLSQVTGQLRAERNRIWIRPEVTGKTTQFGTLDELLELSRDIEGVAPCIDFAHLHARTGKFNSYDEFSFALKQLGNKLGRQALDNMHIHISGIAYGKHGEVKHLNMADADLNYRDFIRALISHKVKGTIVCESPNLEEDAMLLQQTYRTILHQANSR